MDDLLQNAPAIGYPVLGVAVSFIISVGVGLWKLLSGYHQNITKEYVDDNVRLRSENARLDARLTDVTRALMTQEETNSELRIEVALLRSEVAQLRLAMGGGSSGAQGK